MLADLHTTRQRLLAGQTSASTEIGRAIEAAQSARCQHAFLQTSFDQARATAMAADAGRQPLAGLAVSVKDLFDVRGQTSCAGSVVLADAPPADQDAVAVARLRAAGAAFIGRTNMTEFAFSGVGVNPHYGTPANAVATDVPRIPGGSSSGAAVSVATGAAFIGLGSDTGGSIDLRFACGRGSGVVHGRQGRQAFGLVAAAVPDVDLMAGFTQTAGHGKAHQPDAQKGKLHCFVTPSNIRSISRRTW